MWQKAAPMEIGMGKLCTARGWCVQHPPCPPKAPEPQVTYSQNALNVKHDSPNQAQSVPWIAAGPERGRTEQCQLSL